ncbi:MAG TPA: ABC transporter ATP-binding protein [Candidatus Acidoferrales bacterium]|nr:ABC transporter ATP-binding protein [Candidatus Acidoferrales bacterium]
MASVHFEHVDKVYANGVQALRDCNLQIADGELLVLVGPSGCGKSTLLRLLAGLESVTHGTLRINDQVANDLSPQARNVAMVFQDYALYPHMTARANLEFPLKMRRMARTERAAQVKRVAALLEITQLLDRLPKQLSGGQRQRVAMGRALVRQPSVFLLDEPLSNLDAKLRVQVRAEIKDLQQRMRTTMIYVTHDQVEAMTLGDRVAVLDRGVVQQVAPGDELYAKPANAFVAGFIGNPPMNLFPATIQPTAQGTFLRIGGQTLRVAAVAAGAPREVLVGIRPEAISLAGAGDSGLRAIIEHVEYLGHETLAYLRIDEVSDLPRLVARFAGMQHFNKGGAVRVQFDPERVYLFDANAAALPS